MKRFLWVLFVCFSTLSHAQQWIDGIYTVWDDDLSEWTIISDDEEGKLQVRWRINNDITEWDYAVGELNGSIRRRWKEDPTLWEIRGNDGELITARAIWNNNLLEWKVTNNKQTVNVRSKWMNQTDIWEVGDDYGKMEIYTEYEQDPRSWIIVDEAEELSFHFKMAIVFVAVFHSAFR